MAAAHNSTEEGRSTRQYHSDSSIPTEASAKIFRTGPKSEPKASEWASFREIWRRFPRSQCRAWNHLSQLFLFRLIVCTSAAFLMCYRVSMWGLICDHESCFRSLVLALWTAAVATTEKPHETTSSDARRTPKQSLGNCVTESAAVHFTSSSTLFVHCNSLTFIFNSVSKLQSLSGEKWSLHLNMYLLFFRIHCTLTSTWYFKMYTVWNIRMYIFSDKSIIMPVCKSA